MSELTREDVDQLPGAAVLEFGASWCGHCRAVRATVDELTAKHPDVRHIRIEDGPGLPLGRSFHVKLWPTYVFLKQGKILRRLVRPSAASLETAFSEAAIAGEPGA